MTGLAALLQVAGEAALLLWGLHMVQSGIQRAFGSQLHRWLGVALGNSARAFVTGIGATALLQSSTAVALMVAGFATSGAVALAPGLAAMLGANVGTALTVQILAFDMAAAAAPLILLGVVAFRRGGMTRTRDLGRVAIGLGLMFIALHLLVQSIRPLEAAPALRGALALIAGEPLLNLAVAAAIAWAAHSSVAGVLIVAAFAGSGVLDAQATVAMVAGANLGTAITPLLEVGGPGDRARLRLPLGNLLNRLAGCALVLAMLHEATQLLVALDPAPARLAANAHLAFNLVMAALGLPLVSTTARLVRRLLPDPPATRDEGAPRYLDDAALNTPVVALSNAAREALRMVDGLDMMLRRSAATWGNEGRWAGRELRQADVTLDRLHQAIHAYLGRIPRENLSDEEAVRLEEIQGFAIALERAADIAARDIPRHAARLACRATAPGPSPVEELNTINGSVLEHLRLATAVFMGGDVDAARRLVRGKEALREAERAAIARFKSTGALANNEGIAAPGVVLEAVHDLRRIVGLLASIAHPILERRGELLSSRLGDMCASSAT